MTRTEVKAHAKDALQSVLPIARSQIAGDHYGEGYTEAEKREIDAEIVHQIERIADFLGTGRIYYST